MRTYYEDINADFTCKHCGHFVSAWTATSGVVNRNHCPYCLHSRHVDLFAAGDRLCACKALMEPVGLTFKRTRDKYSSGSQGELMVVHRCVSCDDLSVNRIAADDDNMKILNILNNPDLRPDALAQLCQADGITFLTENDLCQIEKVLFGLQVSSMAIA